MHEHQVPDVVAYLLAGILLGPDLVDEILLRTGVAIELARAEVRGGSQRTAPAVAV